VPDNGRWYEPPISPYGIARMFDVAAYHQSPLIFKRNVIALLHPSPAADPAGNHRLGAGLFNFR
jgi:hypothetical protein